MDERDQIGRAIVIAAVIVALVIVSLLTLSILFAILGWWQVVFR